MAMCRLLRAELDLFMCVVLLLFLFSCGAVSIDDYVYQTDSALDKTKLVLDFRSIDEIPVNHEEYIRSDAYEKEMTNPLVNKTIAADNTNQLKNGKHELHKRDVGVVDSPHAISITSLPVTSTTPVNSKQEKPIDINVDETFSKNLGVNGSGQRKDLTTPSNGTTLIHDSTSDLDEDLSDKVDVDSETFNKTLEENNITNTQTDTHLFYNSTLYTDERIGHMYWVDLDNCTDVKVSQLLSNSHRRAATVKLSFEFPFYGSYIKNVTIATGGFLYTGNYVHSWLAATQYIAPLMANFDTSLSNDSFVKYYDNGTAFTVEWQNTLLKDNPQHGEFHFQTTLFENGDIVFVYKNVPVQIKDIRDTHHPVKVGLSDAYIVDRTVYYVRRKTIYEYHRVDFKRQGIGNWTAIYLRALSTCLSYHDCNSCLSSPISNDYKCKWCPGMNQCSTGYDRKRQDWVDQRCDHSHADHEGMCAIVEQQNEQKESKYMYEGSMENTSLKFELERVQNNHIGISGFMAILFMIFVISGLSLWVFYAYRNPHTFSGQMLIRYRPSQWRWRRGEARYTAATIHM